MTQIIYKSGNKVVTLDSTLSYTTLRKKITSNEFKKGEILDSFEGYAMIKPENIVAIIENSSALTKKEEDKAVVTACGINFYSPVRMSSLISNLEDEKLYLNGFAESHFKPRFLVKKELVDAITYPVSENEVDTEEETETEE